MGFISEYKSFFKNWSWLLFLLLIIVLVVFLLVRGPVNGEYGYEGITDWDQLLKIFRKKKIQQKKHEQECRRIFEKTYNAPFKTIRPSFLRYDKTGKNLELDGYNSNLNIGFEYQGKQHDEYTPYFHKNGISDFHKQQERDQFKKDTCEKLGINLVYIPHTVKMQNLESYIKNELYTKNLL